MKLVRRALYVCAACGLTAFAVVQLWKMVNETIADRSRRMQPLLGVVDYKTKF